MQIPVDMPTIIVMVEQDQRQIDSASRAFREIWFNVVLHNINTVEGAIDYLFRKGRGSKSLPNPDLVILGATIPVTDAIHLLSVTRKSRKLQQLPVIAMTAQENVNHGNIAEKLGVALVVPLDQIESQMRRISEIMIDYWFEGPTPMTNRHQEAATADRDPDRR